MPCHAPLRRACTRARPPAPISLPSRPNHSSTTIPTFAQILLQRQAEAPEAVDEVVLERWVLQASFPPPRTARRPSVREGRPLDAAFSKRPAQRAVLRSAGAIESVGLPSLVAV